MKKKAGSVVIMGPWKKRLSPEGEKRSCDRCGAECILTPAAKAVAATSMKPPIVFCCDTCVMKALRQEVAPHLSGPNPNNSNARTGGERTS